MVDLKIGFPEMKLSDELIERLGSSKRTTSTCEACVAAAVSRNAHHEPGVKAEDGYQNGNGFRRDQPMPSAARHHSHESRFSVPPMDDTEPWSPDWTGPGPEEHSENGFGDVPDDDNVIRSFQDTMQEFLRTQQAVMTAYLGDVTDDERFAAPSTAVSTTPIAGRRR